MSLEIIVEQNPVCRLCGSADIVRHGRRYNSKNTVQLYLCKTCGNKWSAGRWKRYRFPPEVIQFACEKVKEGCSSRTIKSLIKEKFGMTVTHTTIVRWASIFTDHRYQRKRPDEAKTKIIEAILSTTTMRELADKTGLPYDTVKTFFRRLGGSHKFRTQSLLLSRIRHLERRLDSIKEDLAVLKKQISRHYFDAEATYKQKIDTGGINPPESRC